MKLINSNQGSWLQISTICLMPSLTGFEILNTKPWLKNSFGVVDVTLLENLLEKFFELVEEVEVLESWLENFFEVVWEVWVLDTCVKNFFSILEKVRVLEIWLEKFLEAVLDDSMPENSLEYFFLK